jgi:ankyrin repeat protein
VSLLLSKGAAAAAVDSEGDVPLHKAAAEGHAEAAKLLLAAPGGAEAAQVRGLWVASGREALSMRAREAARARGEGAAAHDHLL